MARFTQEDLQGQPQLGLPAGSGHNRGFRPGAERTLRRRRSPSGGWCATGPARSWGVSRRFTTAKRRPSRNSPRGGCGFFEAIDDQQVADMMFDASRMWLASRGMEAMDGPINFGQRRDWWGLLVEGYEFQPLYKNPYNPPYYKELFENYGFKNYFNQHSFIWRANVSEASGTDFRPRRTTPLYAGVSCREYRHEPIWRTPPRISGWFTTRRGRSFRVSGP